MPSGNYRANSGGNTFQTRPRHDSTSSSSRLGNLTLEELNSMTKDQLKTECKKRGFRTTGNKKELLSRLGYNKLVAGSSEGSYAVSNMATAHQRSNGDVHRDSDKPQQSEWSGPGRGNGNVSGSGDHDHEVDCSHLVLWRHPITTLKYFGKEVSTLLLQAAEGLPAYKGLVITSFLLSTLIVILFQIHGPHQPILQVGLSKALWWGWWIVLGVLSSVGLGTGLHTFLLYLGPHIAQVTLAAYECGALNFPSPPYPDEIICPTDIDPRWETTIWNIMSKVRVEAMLWGLGTALGELPPYFMARTARLAHKPVPIPVANTKPETMLDRGKILVQQLVEKVGFFGILACASIPNPLFDLAGLTCGHFLVPFWTFFGATLIGKAIIKMHIQKMFVIVAFNEKLISEVLVLLHNIPGGFGAKLEEPLLNLLQSQRSRLHSNPGEHPPASQLSIIFEKIVLAMVVVFLVSIINSLAQSQYRRIHRLPKKNKKQRD